MPHKKIKIEGDLVFMAPNAKDKFKEAEDYKHIELDFSGVDSMDSCGIDLVIKLYHSLRKKSGTLTISNVKPEVLEIFTHTGMTKIIEINPVK